MGSVHEDATRWDERYRNFEDVNASPPEPLGELADLRALIPSHGTALDIACGPGAQTLWLADRGLHVTAIDVSAVAIDRLRAAALTAGLAERIDARRVDLDDGLPAEPRHVDVLVCQRFRNPALYGEMIERLDPGGIGIVTVLSAVGAPGGAFHAPPGELMAAFTQPGVELLHATEADGVATVMFQRAT